MILMGRKRIGKRCWVGVEFKAADLWVGAYWDRRRIRYFLEGAGTVNEELHLWICLLPCLPIHLIIPRLIQEFVPHGEA